MSGDPKKVEALISNFPSSQQRPPWRLRMEQEAKELHHGLLVQQLLENPWDLGWDDLSVWRSIHESL